ALLVIPLVNVVLAAAPAQAAGGASGLFSTAQQVGGAVGIAAIGTVFFGYLGSHSLAASFTHAAPYAAGAFLVCAALSLVLPKTPVADDPDSPAVRAGSPVPAGPPSGVPAAAAAGTPAGSARRAGASGHLTERVRVPCESAASRLHGPPAPGATRPAARCVMHKSRAQARAFRASRRCREASYKTIDTAFAAFRELAAPTMGMLTATSLSSRHAPLSPVPSFPASSSTGWVKSKSNTSRSPRSSVAARMIGQAGAGCAATHAATSRGPGARTTGSANSEPVLARTHRGS